MADHVRKTGNIEGNPMLANAYVKFDPVPDGWKDMVKQYKIWLENPDREDGQKFEDPKLLLVIQAAEVLTNDMAKQISAPAEYNIVVRDGSLILEILITIPIIDLISEDLIKSLHMMASDEDLDKWDAAKLLGKLVGEIKLLDRQVRKIGTALNELVQSVIGREHVIRPESRVGILSNILKFHDSLSSAKIKTNSLKVRSSRMKEALKQLKKIVSVLQKEADKRIIYSYLLIRTRDLVELEGTSNSVGNDSIDTYNKCVKEIILIKDQLSELNF